MTSGRPTSTDVLSAQPLSDDKAIDSYRTATYAYSGRSPGFGFSVSTRYRRDEAETSSDTVNLADELKQLEFASESALQGLIAGGELALLRRLEGRYPQARSVSWIYEQIGSTPDEIERRAAQIASADGFPERLAKSVPDWYSPPAGILLERLRWLVGRLRLEDCLERELVVRPLVEERLAEGKSLHFLGLHPLDVMRLLQEWGLTRRQQYSNDPIQTLYERSKKLDRYRGHPYFERWQLNEATARTFMMEGVDRRPFIFGR